jgi:hypothetical protein
MGNDDALFPHRSCDARITNASAIAENLKQYRTLS